MLFRSPLSTLLLAMTLLAGCRRPPAAAEPELLRFETRKFEQVLPGCGDKLKREEPCVTFRVQYPDVVHAVSPEVRTKINAAIMAHLQPGEAPRGFAQEAAQTIEEFQRFHKEFPDSAIAYFTRREAGVISLNPALLCIEVNSEEFRGGAHPNSARDYINLRPKTGEDVALRELVQDGAMPRLLAVVEKRFRAERGIDEGKNLSDAGFTFPDDRFELPKNWGVTGKGLAFHYNAYEVGPYVMGPTTVLAPWSDLRGVIRADAGILPGQRKYLVSPLIARSGTIIGQPWTPPSLPPTSPKPAG